MNEPDTPPTPPSDSDREQKYHTYATHHIPWYVRAMWIAFWIGLVWYLIRYAVPSAKNYF